MNKAFQYSKSDLAQLFASAPPADILLTHGPVETMGPALNWAVLNRPIVCVSGHVHEDHGAAILDVAAGAAGAGRIGGNSGALEIPELTERVLSVNVCTMNAEFTPANPPVVLDIPVRRAFPPHARM